MYGPADDDGTDNITTRYKYDKDDRTTQILFDEKEEERSVKYEYDGLGRIKTKKVRNGGEEIPIDEDEQAEDDPEYTGEILTIGYEYLDSKDANATTPLVNKIKLQGAVNADLEYEYDAKTSNILSESCDIGNGRNQYEYDKLGQLIRANVRNDQTIRNSGVPGMENKSGTTWTYEYDLGGNILSKSAYELVSGVVEGEPIKKVLYEYNNPLWRDQMTAYDGKPIAYDLIGNPTNYDGWTYIWCGGRKLVQMFRDGYRVNFMYNPSGLRTRKRVIDNGDITDYDYFLHGKLLTHLVKTHGAEKDELHFYYDAQSKPIMMRFGDDEGGQYYTFIHSMQGDILGIVDKKQQLVVEYLYDPWGRLLDTKVAESDVTSLELAEILAKLNPFRYRGYLYDEETGLYYLRSRYYNPDFGRFINEDSLFGAPGNLLSHNLYVYCRNSPNSNSDQSGKDGSPVYGWQKSTFYLNIAAFRYSLKKNVAKIVEPSNPIMDAAVGVAGVATMGAAENVKVAGKAVGEVASTIYDYASAGITPFLSKATEYENFFFNSMSNEAGTNLGLPIIGVKIDILIGSHSGEVQVTYMDSDHNLIQGEIIEAHISMWSEPSLRSMISYYEDLANQTGGLYEHKMAGWKESLDPELNRLNALIG